MPLSALSLTPPYPAIRFAGNAEDLKAKAKEEGIDVFRVDVGQSQVNVRATGPRTKKNLLQQLGERIFGKTTVANVGMSNRCCNTGCSGCLENKE